MRIILVLLSALFVATSCDSGTNSGSQTPVDDTVKAPEVVSKTLLIDSAKTILLTANEYVRKGILKEMPNDEVNKKINPLMASFFAIYQSLPPEDTMVLYEFRIAEVNKLIDLQVEHMN